MRILSLKKKTLPKLAVLAAGLAVATMAATVHPTPAQAYPTGTPLSSCAGCHSGGVTTPGATATAPTTALVAGTNYIVTVTPMPNAGGGMTGYSIVPRTPDTRSATATGTTAAYEAIMTAPGTAGSYTYDVYTVQGKPGTSSSTTYTITVAAPVVTAPVANFTTSVASGTFPLLVTMTDTSTNTPTSWLWDLGDGTTSTVQNPTVTYTTAGIKTVTLVATNSGGSSVMVSKTITVTAPVVVTAPVADFTTSVASGTFPLTVTMSDTSTNTPTSWLWTLGDGTTSTVQNPTVTYTTAGTKTVTLIATNSGGSSAAVSKTITVTAPVVTAPVASFTTSVASGTFPLLVTMSDTSTNTPTSWLWTLGDGTTSTVQNPTVTYTTAGTKTVTLIATNSGGASAAVSKTITVTAPVAPGVPTGVTAKPGNGQVVVSWAAVAGATSYTVTANPGLKSVTASGTTATITGLTNGVSYTFTVTATNAAGTSEPSLASAAVTPTLPIVPVGAPVAGPIPEGSPSTGAGGASQPGPWTGLGGLVLLLAGAAMVPAIRRRRRA